MIVGEKGKVDIKVKDGREALAELASEFYGNPQKKLKLIGITGTNGKTSTAIMLTTILNKACRRAFYLGTLGNDFTTPDPVNLYKILTKAVKEKNEFIIMETTSQGLAQKRLHNLQFAIGVFTNLTQDHLDYHRNIEDYADSKKILFQQSKIAVLNCDDKFSHEIAKDFKGKIIYYGKTDLKLKMPGEFNKHNAGAAEAVALSLGVKKNIISEVLKKITIPGRFEPIDCGQNFIVTVDYAHTPDALENILINARKLTGKKIILVFGCGGDRDRDKRPKMARTATKLADYTIITSDNPRTEDPKQIFSDIKKGFVPSANYELIADRREAINKAIKIAKKNDIVLIAGKGHEDYQIIGTQKIHFDDREEVRKALKICLKN